MRVIAGRYRGRRLDFTVPEGVRPSTDRFRETLFNVLGPEVEGARCLDLFAGSGAIGIEALSRGAEFVIFNDRNFRSVRLIGKNLRLCGIREGYEIHQRDAVALARKLSTDPLNLVFLDPPYAYHNHVKLLAALRDQTAVRATTLIMLELFKKTPVPPLHGWEIQRELRVGDSRIVLLSPSALPGSATG